MSKKAAIDGERDASNRSPSHWWRAYALRSAVDGPDSGASKAEPKPDRASAASAKPARAAARKS
jgi:hypothetical protein